MEGMTKLLKLTIIGLYATWIHANLTKDELETVLSSLRLFNSGKCILTVESDDGTAKDVVKHFGRSLISTAVVSVSEMEEFLTKTKPPDETTAIVVKVKSIKTIKKLLVENSARLHWFLWFIITEDKMDPEIRIPFNCQLFQIQRDPFRTHRLIEYYHWKNSSNYKNEFGIWIPGKGLKTSLLNMSRRRTDLQGVPLKITVCGIYGVEKSIEKFWRDSAKFLNYTLKSEPKNMNKTPLTLEDFDGTACISAITALDIESDWIFSSFGLKVKLLTKFRGTNEVGWRAYVQPFTKEMWMAVCVWLLLTTAAIVIVNGCSVKTLYINTFTVFFCLCCSDPMAVHPPNEPIPLPTKFVYLMSLAAPSVIVPAYSAYILSTLSVTRPFEPFYDTKGFIADGTYRLTAVSNTFATRYLRGSKDKDLNYIYYHLFEGADNQAPTFSALFDRICKDNKLVGLFVDLRVLRRLFRCQMFVVPQVVLTISIGLLLPKGYPLRKILNERMSEYSERGIKQRELNAELHAKKFFDEETGELHSLNMSQMQALFILLALGVILSLIVLAVEIAVKKHSKPDRNSPGGV